MLICSETNKRTKLTNFEISEIYYLKLETIFFEFEFAPEGYGSMHLETTMR